MSNYYGNPYVNGYYQHVPYYQQPQAYHPYYRSPAISPYYSDYRITGQATWTDGGQVTKCNIPWSDNQYMTAAVGENTPYQCGQTLKIRNLSEPGQREILVEVVDRVAGYPANRINLHRRAFEALGANVSLGVINVEIIPTPELEQEKWGKYLLAVTQSAYPGYRVTDYKSVGKTQISPTQTREIFEYILHSQQEQIKIRGTVVYNPNTDRVISFDIKEV
ncbi:DUF3889 domain-containing protein [Bacillus sp. Marseille-P3661]|uniref:DUF3889 domain-containing protein n=1 Tax=Bacillus sp. Marseille-P3661 TaxID=1936234 RepID=UPI000C855642|nr:DUF3889 domain-containing protein [Bacillus sp. Marseille-P3661]